MKFVTFEFETESMIGILLEDKIIKLKYISMLDFLRSEEALNLKKLEEQIHSANSSEIIDINKVKLLSPIPYPFRNVICLGKNYSDHVKELATFTGSSNIPESPIYFTKTAYPAVAPNGNINLNYKITKALDYEVELAIVIGKQGKDIKQKNAEEYIFGYTILNDVSAREIQKSHQQWFRGKSLDGNCPIGPCIVSKDEIPFPVSLDISSKVNGELRQHSNTKNMIFDIPFIISQLSSGMELYPGDIIATGTPSGVGQGFNPPKYLKDGDVVECTIEKIGTLKNIVR